MPAPRSNLADALDVSPAPTPPAARTNPAGVRADRQPLPAPSKSLAERGAAYT